MKLLVLTQLVIRSPPEVENPSLHINVNGKEHVYRTDTVLSQGKRAFVEADGFWLIYIDRIAIQTDSLVVITLTSKDIIIGSIRATSISPGIDRYFKKDFFIRRYLPNEIFIDVIIEEESEAFSSNRGMEFSPALIAAISTLSPPKESVSMCHPSHPEEIPSSTESSRDKDLSPAGTVDTAGVEDKEKVETPAEKKNEAPVCTASSSIEKAVVAVNSACTALEEEKSTSKPDCITQTPSKNEVNNLEEIKKDGNISEKESRAIAPPKIGRILPPPPGMIIRPAVNMIQGVDLLFKTLFPRVGWKPIITTKGTIYEKTLKNRSRDQSIEKRWKEIEEDFRKKFCIQRGQKIEQFTKNHANPKKKQIITERQEFLLSIVFESIRKRKIPLSQISNELVRWIETEEHVLHIEDIVNLCDVFPEEKDCIKVLECKSGLTETENLLRELLCGGCTKTKLLLIKYVHWAEPSLHMLIDSLETILKGISAVEQDDQLPLFLVLLLHTGNLVNYKYAENNSKTEAKGFHLSSVSAFSKSSAEMATNGGCRMSLMELVIISSRDIIDFKELVKTYEIFYNMPLKSLKEHHAMIHTGFNDISSMCDSAQKKNRLQNTHMLLKESTHLIDEIERKMDKLSFVYATAPDSITECMVDAITSIQKNASLFR